MRVTIVHSPDETTVDLHAPGPYAPDLADDLCRRAADLVLRCAAITAYVDSGQQDDGE